MELVGEVLLVLLFVYFVRQRMRYDKWEKGNNRDRRPPFHPPRS